MSPEAQARLAQVNRRMRRTRLAGVAIAALFLAALIGWGIRSEINGAVIAQGSVEFRGDVAPVQHREGGIVTALLVEEGAEVDQGTILARLDDTDLRAQIQIIRARRLEAEALAARLRAELAGADEIPAPEIALHAGEDLRLDAMLASQQAILETRTGGLRSLVDGFGRRAAQMENEIEAVRAQLSAAEELVALTRTELAEQEDLFSRGIVTKERIGSLRRNLLAREGEAGAFRARLAQIENAMGENDLDRLRTEEERRTEILAELRATEARIGELVEQEMAIRTRFEATVVRAPMSGVVHALEVKTAGGVVGAGQTLMHIVPRDEALVVEARLSPADVDQVDPGQNVQIRFPSVRMPGAPIHTGTVVKIAPERTLDAVTGEEYFEALIEIDRPEVFAEYDMELRLGIPVEAHIRTAARSPLSYLTAPLTDQVARAMRDG